MNTIFLPPVLRKQTKELQDQNHASQVELYRQLLHTECQPELRFSWPSQEETVQQMPWWEQSIDETSNQRTLSYNDLIVRLWKHGCIGPFSSDGDAEAFESDNECTTVASVVPHEYWVDRLGFQQSDPLFDFRSGGVLSLALLVYTVESCPQLLKRFLPNGDTHMLPFASTCLNITNLICKFTNRFDNRSQKPFAFWKLFSEATSLVTLQEICTTMLCNVVVEMTNERKWTTATATATATKKEKNGRFQGQNDQDKVTVFDFADILARTEHRVENDLFGSEPKSVAELRCIHDKLCLKYANEMKLKKIRYQLRNHHKNDTKQDMSFTMLAPQRPTLVLQATRKKNKVNRSIIAK